MKTLSETWFAEGYIDFELKKYTLLAYLQNIQQQFEQNKLYPHLADIVFHYNNIVSLRENKRLMQHHFPKRLTGIQLEKLSLLYKQMNEDDELMQELEDIIQYAARQMKKAIDAGAEIYDFVSSHIHIEPIGLVPLDKKEGYFCLHSSKNSTALVYHYRISLFEKHDEQFRSIQTKFIDQWQLGLCENFESIKLALIRYNKDLPNPAVFAAETDYQFPIQETLLPIARRSLVKYISTGGYA